jgi:TetR/AcrR family transcriptional repressor of nem operon
MKKTERTKQRIVVAAAELFNQKGYAGTHIRDIMQATGLAKGGIYGNFASKEEIEVAAFDHAVNCVMEPIVEELAQYGEAPAKLHALLRLYEQYGAAPPLPGGCPILNTSIEADDAHGPLREKVIGALDQLHGTISSIISDGQQAGEIQRDVDPSEMATHMLATIEGGIMIGKAYGDRTRLEAAIRPLHRMIDEQLAPLALHVNGH